MLLPRGNWRRLKKRRLAGLPASLWPAGIVFLVAGYALATAGQEPSKSAATQNKPATTVIRSESNLVTLRVVVTDSQGKPVSGLTQADFQVFDNNKPQMISHFSVESEGSTSSAGSGNGVPRGTENPLPSPIMRTSAPQRYAAIFFDNYHLEFNDLASIRDAAKRYLAKNVSEGAQAAIFSASGNIAVGFTSDLNKLDQALSRLRYDPPPLLECMDPPIYVAQQVEDMDQEALDVAKGIVRGCVCRGPAPCPDSMLDGLAREAAMGVVIQNDRRTEATLAALDSTVRQMAGMPGERTIALLSDGFLDEHQTHWMDALIDRALHANVVISCLDARGLYAESPGGSEYVHQGMKKDSNPLATVAAGTGGIFVENTNDLEGGLAKAASPQTAYVLGFYPEDLKSDGRFHPLKVTLVNETHFSVQARIGYFAPTGKEDAATVEREQMEQAIFSNEDIKDLPIQIRSRFTRVDAQTTKINVFVGANMQSARFRKESGLNLDDLTLIVALFDRDGKYIAAKNQTINLRLSNAKLEQLKTVGGQGEIDFDVKPGSYVVRAVLRESESKRLGAASQNVEVP